MPPKGAGTLAELYLSRVAQHARRTRKVYGGFLVALSSLLAAEAVAVGAGEPEALNGALAALVAWGVGLHSLGTPSNEERELKRVLAIQDLAKRERVGGQALGALSQCARARRLLYGLGWALAATYYLVAQPIKERAVETVGWDVAIVEKPSPLNYVSGALYSSFALWCFATRSVAEEAFREYREAIGEAEGARLRAYLDRRGRVGLGLRITL
ncbi:MAG: hypothetical protein ONB23_04500 [candidate division KSB1 bacterium]|nr:hypothetical protein [candidate division KSB1 bacterium]